MIRMPQRSVTRFFIPMIDVLTLLFCMFLLLPIMRENESTSQEAGTPEDLAKLLESQQLELKNLELDRQRALAILAELAQKKTDLVRQNVFIRLLYVSPKDGSLHYFDPANLKQPALSIADGASAAALISRHKKEAGERELLYIFQEPRGEVGDVAPYPTRSQEERYKQWFKDVNYDGCVKPPPSKGRGG